MTDYVAAAAPGELRTAPRSVQPLLLTGLGGLTLLAVAYVIALPRDLLSMTVLLSVVGAVCIGVMRSIPRGNGDFFDPGLLAVFFVLSNIWPLPMAHLLGLDVIHQGWLIRDGDVFATVVLGHIFLLSVFILVYTALAQSPKLYAQGVSYRHSPLAGHLVWLLLWIGLMVVNFSVNSALGVELTRAGGEHAEVIRAFEVQQSFLTRQILIHLSQVTSFAGVVAIGVLVSRARTLTGARKRLFFIPLVLTAIQFMVFASRGGVFVFFVAGAYADVVRWRGRLLNWRLALVVVLGGFLALHGANIVERWVFTGEVDGWQSAMFTSYEPRLVENAGVVVVQVDQKLEPLRRGGTYVDAVRAIVPTQLRKEPIEQLSTKLLRWSYTTKVGTGIGLAGSAVGEGYLNNRMTGVAVQAALLAAMTAGIRYLVVSRHRLLIAYGPIAYAIGVSLMYGMFRTDVIGLVKSFQWILILLPALIAAAIMLRTIAGRGRETGAGGVGAERGVPS